MAQPSSSLPTDQTLDLIYKEIRMVRKRLDQLYKLNLEDRHSLAILRAVNRKSFV